MTRKVRRETSQEYDVNGYPDDKTAAVVASFNLVLKEHLSWTNSFFFSLIAYRQLSNSDYSKWTKIIIIKVRLNTLVLSDNQFLSVYIFIVFFVFMLDVSAIKKVWKDLWRTKYFRKPCILLLIFLLLS